jgi:hypothetical protein
MEKLTPKERFGQLLLFLKDPLAHLNPNITITDFVWREVIRKPNPDDELSWPQGLPLGGYVELYEREHTTWRVQAYRKEAIEIMESGMFREGHLRGTMKTQDILIENLEAFVLQLAAVFHNVKHHILRSPFDNKGKRLRDFIREDFLEMIMAFHVWSGLITRSYLARRDKIKRIEKELNSIQKKVDEKTQDKISFNPINEFIFIFLIHTEAPANLIATHIYEFFDKRRGVLPENIFLPLNDAIRKRVEKRREQFMRAYYL